MLNFVFHPSLDNIINELKTKLLINLRLRLERDMWEDKGFL